MKGRLDPHARYRELLAARLDRQLSRAENRLLIVHVRSCDACQQVERDYRDQSQLLRALPTPLPPRDMWARTSTALDREVSRWVYRFPRFPRRVLLRAGRSAGTPSALATVVAALGVVTALVALQLAPVLKAPASDATAANARPTPFAVQEEPLSFVALGSADLSLFQTHVNQVCPASTPDCFNDSGFVERHINLKTKVKPQNVAMSAEGRVAFVGQNSGRDVIAVVLLTNEAGPASTPTEPTLPGTPVPTDQPTATPTLGSQSEPPGDGTPGPTIDPSESQPPQTPDSPPTATTGTGTGETPLPTATAAALETPRNPESSPITAHDTPPASAVPGLVVLSILENVHSAGAPPAWSRDGEVLAFSAMPADGSHGPDVYVWRPGDSTAQPITNDHTSYFASWSGQRIVASRLNQTDGKSDRLEVLTVVIDPQTLEERQVGGPLMWLPVVDPQREHAITWSGTLDLTGELPAVISGGLYLVDWTALDPFAADDGLAVGDDPALGAIAPLRDPAADPVIDWHARWSPDGSVLGLWEADAPGGSIGKLSLLAYNLETGSLTTDDAIFGPVYTKRGFTLGTDRVAYVALTDANTEGQLRISTWGPDGVGDLRIDTLDLQELIPSF